MTALRIGLHLHVVGQLFQHRDRGADAPALGVGADPGAALAAGQEPFDEGLGSQLGDSTHALQVGGIAPRLYWSSGTDLRLPQPRRSLGWRFVYVTAVITVSSLVLSPRIISTNFMRRTGLKK